MPQLLYTFACPIAGLDFEFVLDLGTTQAQYTEGLAANEYRALVDISNWEQVMGDVPKPVFPLTAASMSVLPFVAIRYISSGELIGDGLDAFMEARSPNLRTR